MSVDDPSAAQRAAWLDTALAASAVAAGTARDRMVLLRRGDIRNVGASRCGREYNCTQPSASRAWCGSYSVTFYCAYEVTDQSGAAATAVLAVHPPAYRPSDNAIPLSMAAQKLCELGYGCQPRAHQQ